MDIEEIKTHLNNIEACPFDEEVIDEAIDIIDRQAETIESLKCCGNCNNYGQGSAMNCKKDFDCSLFCKDDLINNWQPIN